MSSDRREFYASSNGDRWYLCREADGEVVVLHQPNEASGGKPSKQSLGVFLFGVNRGPEHQTLRDLIGSLVERSDILTIKR
jgi:hypothetical protein